jgi:hypothetical protein
MVQSSVNPSDSVEDFLAREQLLTEELSPKEFAEYIVGCPASNGERPHPRRAWNWQIALALAIPALLISLQSTSRLLIVLLAALTAISLSLGILLLTRSSTLSEVRQLTMERKHFRDETLSYARYADFLSEALISLLLVPASADEHSGAPLILDLLDRARCALVAAGRQDAALFILRHEDKHALLTYSSLPRFQTLPHVTAGSLLSNSSSTWA